MEKKKSKLPIIIFVILGVILVLIAVAVFLMESSNQTNSNLATLNTSTSKNTISNSTQNTSNTVSGSEDEENASNTDFSFKFLKLENENKNLIYSPLSIKYALNMLNDGANGETKEQIENLLNNEKVTKYENIEDVLSLANAFYIQNDYSNYVKPDYINLLSEKYNAEVKYNPLKSAGNINKWISEKTFNQINDLLEDDQVTGMETILVNALAIDMNWENRFEAENTKEDTFYLDSGDQKYVAMMTKKIDTNSASYYKNDDIKAISMNLKDYDGTKLEFIAIMPNKNLSEYVSNFNIDNLNDVISSLKPASTTSGGVLVNIPRFSYEESLNFQSDLTKLGITDAFNSEKADFSNMSTSELYIGQAIHKANIDFNEDGIKAAAVTIFAAKTTAIAEQKKPVEITFDKPFLYVIRDKNTGEIWFVGTVYEPTSWDEVEKDYRMGRF